VDLDAEDILVARLPEQLDLHAAYEEPEKY
jgi:hypothetical protein